MGVSTLYAILSSRTAARQIKKNRKIWLIYSQRDATHMSLHVHSETVKQLLHIDKKSEEAK